MASFARPPPPAATPGAPSRTANLPPWLVRTAEYPALAWSTSAVLLGALPLCVRSPAAFPRLIQLPLFAAIFGASGYMVHVGDPLNGSGTTTAWSLIYLLLNTRKAIVARSPAALAVTSVVATQAGLYGSYYFGQD